MIMTLTTNPVILLKEDYTLLNNYFKTSKPPVKVNEKLPGKSLKEELDNAVVVTREKFPPDVVRLNSSVIIKEMETNRVMAIKVVMPQQADIRNNKISVLAPLGTALIGFRKDQQVTWPVPGGVKNFVIMEVYNSPEENETE